MASRSKPIEPRWLRTFHLKKSVTTGYPRASPEVTPTAVLLPMNGFDREGYSLGYGAGFFGRTLAALKDRRPAVIGVAFELAAIETIQPQPWD